MLMGIKIEKNGPGYTDFLYPLVFLFRCLNKPTCQIAFLKGGLSG